MKQVTNKKLTIFLAAVILVMGVLIVLKIVNRSYALPTLETPVINDVVKTTDNPLQVQIKYTLTNVQEDYFVEIINNTEAKTYKENISKYEGSNEYYVNDLEKGKTYEFSVKMCSSENNCVESSSKSIEIEQETQTQSITDTQNKTQENSTNTNTNTDKPLGKVTNITATKTTNNSISVKWNAVSNATGYKVKYKVSSSSKWNEHKLSGTSVNIRSLKSNTRYDVSVAPLKNATTGVWYTKSFLTNPYVPNIGGFSVKTLSYSQIKITWKKINNKNINYQLYRSTNGKKWSKIKTFGRNTTSYTNKKLKANKKYYYKMRVIDTKTQRGKTFYGNYTGTKKVKTPLKNKKTYIVISIKKQKLWYYKKGKLVLKSDVVTGKKGKTHTPRGTYKIRGKARSAYLVGRDYVSFVNYWMLIDARTQIGLHDATWRSKFGGTIYKRNGSHGCINLPLKTAKAIYKKAPVGTKVIVK